MRRRELLTFACGAAASAAAPLRLRAQPTMPVIGLLCGGTAETDAYRLNAFKQGLSEGGYNEGRNVALSIAGPSCIMIDCRRSRQNWCSARST